MLLVLLLALAHGAHARDRLYRTCASPIPALQTRMDIPKMLESEKLMRGAELGVLQGFFSRETLALWPSAVEYILVDLWGPQENYLDLANAEQAVQDQRMMEAVENTNPWSKKITICRNFTTHCAKLYPDEYLDYLYVDARHDRLGVLEDLEAWWPKVKIDGFICGCVWRVACAAPTDTCQSRLCCTG